MSTRERERQGREEERKRNLTRTRGWIIVWMLRSGIARPPRLNCDQGLNGDFQGRWRYVTDFYDLFALAVCPRRPAATYYRFRLADSAYLVCSVA